MCSAEQLFRISSRFHFFFHACHMQPSITDSSSRDLKFSLYGSVQQWPELVSGSPVNHMSDPCPDGWEVSSQSEVLLFLLNFLGVLLSKACGR